MDGQSSQFSLKRSSGDKLKSYGFGTTWGWVYAKWQPFNCP